MDVADRDLRGLPPPRGHVGHDAGKAEVPPPGTVLEVDGGVAVLLVLEQSLNEILADQFHRLLGLLGTGHEGPCFDFEEHAGQLHELPDLIDRQRLENLQRRNELRGDDGDRHLGDVHFLPLDEEQEEVHRPREDVGGDLELHAGLWGWGGRTGAAAGQGRLFPQAR